jgi:Protein of unknown function (DUF3347)
MKRVCSVHLLLLILLTFCVDAAETKYPKILEQYEITRAALANDDLAGAKDGATNLALAVKEELGGSKMLMDSSQRLASSATLDDARREFQTISSEMVKLVEGQEGFYVMTCPMIKGSVWIQTTSEVSNPYKGQEMIKCGQIKRPDAR